METNSFKVSSSGCFWAAAARITAASAVWAVAGRAGRQAASANTAAKRNFILTFRGR
jgi:hypothetical protein